MYKIVERSKGTTKYYTVSCKLLGRFWFHRNWLEAGEPNKFQTKRLAAEYIMTQLSWLNYDW